MADIVLDFPNGPIRRNFSRVSLKKNWSDDWEVNPNIHGLQATWSAAPQIGQAVLHYRYGRGTTFGSGTVETLEKLTDIQRQFVRIEDVGRFGLAGGDATIRTWTGVIASASDRLGGLTGVDDAPLGVQTIQCYGCEYLLDRQIILDSTFQDPVNGEQKCQRGLVFNKEKNRSVDKVSGRYLFNGNEAYYKPFSTGVEWWSTRDIVEYLLTEQLPRDAAGVKHFDPSVPATELDKLPSKDRPVIDVHGRSVFDVLNQLIPRHRLMGWYLDSNVSVITFRVFRMHADDITLPGTSNVLPANSQKKKLQIQQDPTASVELVDISTDDVDQVVCQGARRRVCFSLTNGQGNIFVSRYTSLQGWSGTQRSAYNSGGSGEPGFPAAGEVAAQERRAAEVRSRDELRDVYSRFTLMHRDFQATGSRYWDFETSTDDDYKIVFPKDDDPDEVEIQFRPDIRFVPRLPLLNNVKYHAGNVNEEQIEAAALPFTERPCFVLVPDPAVEDKYRYIDKQGALNTETTAWNEDRRWSAAVSIDDDGKSIRLSVHQKPRHILAGDDFSPQDFDMVLPAADWRDFIFTVAVEDDRYTEGRYPEDANLPTDVQQLRQLRIDVGDDFRYDYLVPDTVVGIDVEGNLLRTNGGKVRDDRPQLNDIARMAFEWYSSRKQMLRFRTGQDSSEISLGVMVTEFVYSTDSNPPPPEDVNTVITEISKTWPLTESEDTSGGSEPDATMLMVETDFSELDPLRL